MKKPHIPQPCHEDWNLMTDSETSEEQGRFCVSCAKVVVDFTKMNDAEVIDYLQQNAQQKTCGHFRSDQLLQKQKINIDIANLPKNITYKNIFVACFIAVFSSLFFISCHNNTRPEQLGEIVIIDSNQKSSNDTVFSNTLVDGKVAIIDSSRLETGELAPL